MKRTDITELFPDATKEQINKLLGINGADINSAKGELDTLKGQLTTTQAELQKLKENGGQPDVLLKEAKEAITKLQSELDGMKHQEALRTMREKVSGEKKIPAALLTGETEEDCAKQAEAILAFTKINHYPVLADAGEPIVTHKMTTREKFAQWLQDVGP